MLETEKHIEVWDNCLRILKNILEEQQYQTWFVPIKPIAFSDSTLSIEVPSHFFREYLEDSFLDAIKLTLKRVIGNDAKLVYHIKTVQSQPVMKIPASKNGALNNKEMSITINPQGGNPGPFVYPGIVHKVKVDPRLNKNYNFSNIVEGDCNKMGLTAGRNIALAPGKTPFNPLFIFGGPGVGKTHLAQAIGIATKEKYPDLIVLYVTGNEFKTQYMDAIVGNRQTDFLAFYMKIDVLIVDDIQDLLGKGTQNAFFNVFNYLHQSGKQLIFTSDRPAVDLQNFEERLLSRFKWGLSVQLGYPDYKTRLEMVKSRAFREGVQFDDKFYEFLASNIRTNFRELEGVLISVVAYKAAQPEMDAIAIAAGLIQNVVGEEKKEITIDKVQQSVCDYFGITRDDILSRSRKRQIVQARQIAMFLSRQLVENSSLSTIGSELGGKDHTTVLHSCNTVSDLMVTDKSFRKYVKDIEQMLVSARS